MHSRQLIWTAVRLVLAWGVLSGLALAFGGAGMELLSPWLKYVIEQLLPEFSARIELVRQGYETQILLDARALYPFTISEGFRLPPGATIKTGTHLSHALIPPVLLFSLLIAWPARSLRGFAISMAMGLVASFVLVTLTTPMLLAGKLEMFFAELAAQRGLAYDAGLLIEWAIFTEMGGRWLLPILAFGGILLLRRRRPEEPDDSPADVNHPSPVSYSPE